MKLTSEEALNILSSERGKLDSDMWIEHQICVGNTAGKLAKALGIDEEYAGICILHSYLNNDIDCIAADKSDKNGLEYNFQSDYVKNHIYTDAEKIINLCDLMCTSKVLTMEKRLIDLIIRHGVFKTTQYHIKEALKLKQYFDNKLGNNLYSLFPEIKENI